MRFRYLTEPDYELDCNHMCMKDVHDIFATCVRSDSHIEERSRFNDE